MECPLTDSSGAISLMEGTRRRCAKSKMRLRLSRYSMAAIPTYCEADVARAAPATPQPNTKMKTMSMVKFATLDRAADIRGVLHKVSHLVTYCHPPGTHSAMVARL